MPDRAGEPRTRLGIYAGFERKLPFGDRIAMIRDAGFDATALWWDPAEDGPRKRYHLTPEIVRKAGLQLDHVHVPYRDCNDLWSDNPETRDASVQRHIGWVGDCARHDIPTLVMHVTLGKRPPTPNPQGIESFRRIVGAGEDAGVAVAIENTRSNQHLDAVFSELPSPALGLCYDNSHDALYGDEPLRLLDNWGHLLGATHLSDTDGKRDQHWLPGDGSLDFDACTLALAKAAYDGPLMLEVSMRMTIEGPAAFLARAYECAFQLKSRYDTCSSRAAGQSASA